MKTLEQVKKEKNYLAHQKGYMLDPEGFSYDFLFSRFYDELGELQAKIETKNKNNDGQITLITDLQFYKNDSVMEELGDLSNFIDYIATKIITGYPTKYKPCRQGWVSIES